MVCHWPGCLDLAHSLHTETRPRIRQVSWLILLCVVTIYRCGKTILPQILSLYSVYCKCSLLFSCVRSALRNWQFQVSKDGTSWVTLRTHKDDTSLNEPGSTATWSLSPPEDEKQGWRHIKIQQTGRDASGQTHYLSVSGLEIYGSVNGVCDDLGKKIILYQQWILKMFRNWEDSENSLWISCR